MTPLNRHLADLERARQTFVWTATRVGEPGCRVRVEAQAHADTLERTIRALRAVEGYFPGVVGSVLP